MKTFSSAVVVLLASLSTAEALLKGEGYEEPHMVLGERVLRMGMGSGKTAAPTPTPTCTPLGQTQTPTASKSGMGMGGRGGKSSKSRRELRMKGMGSGKSGKTAAPSFFCSEAPSAAPTQSCALEIDLSVANTITITAGPMLATATVVGMSGFSNFEGILLGNFFSVGGTGAGGAVAMPVVGAGLVPSEQTASGFPFLFSVAANAPNLNIFNMAMEFENSFTMGTVPFTGGTSFVGVPPEFFADVAAGPGMGTIYFPAAFNTDIAGATAIGNWCVTVPAPAGTVTVAVPPLAAAVGDISKSDILANAGLCTGANPAVGCI